MCVIRQAESPEQNLKEGGGYARTGHNVLFIKAHINSLVDELALNYKKYKTAQVFFDWVTLEWAVLRVNTNSFSYKFSFSMVDLEEGRVVSVVWI